MGKFLSIILFVLLGHAACFGSAANVYLASAAAGAADGSSCANARIYTYFNSSGNWGSGATQIGDDTVVHICGTITVAASASALTFQASGTSGHPVTVIFETGAILQSPVFSNSGGINTNSKHYLVIDGNHTGTIQNTDSGAALTYHQNTSLINFSGSHDVEIANFDVDGGLLNTYVHTDINNLSGATGDGVTMTYTCSGTCQISAGAAVSVAGVSIAGYNYTTPRTVVTADASTFTVAGTATGSGSGGRYSAENNVGTAILCNTCYVGTLSVNIHDNVIEHALLGISVVYGSGGTASDITLDSNTIRNANIAIRFGAASSTANLSDFTISNGDYSDSYNWDDISNFFHHNGMHLFATPPGDLNDGRVFGNYFHGDPGTNQTSQGVFTENVHGSAQCNGLLVYNNIFTSDTTAASNYQEYKNSTYICSYNNTFMPPYQTGAMVQLDNTTTNIDFRNNVVVSANIGVNGQGPSATVSADTNNNVYYNLRTGFVYNGSFGLSFASWKVVCSCDASSVTTNPNIDSDGYLQSGSSAIGAGQNLSAFFTTDKDGSARPAVGAWDAGAYIYGVPTLSSISPSTGAEGATVAVTLTGTGFSIGSASISVSGAGITVNNTTVVSDTSITADFVIASSAAVGSRNVTVTTDGGTSTAVTFTITCTSASLAFTNQPQNAALGLVLGTVTVAVRCGDGTTNTASSAAVALANTGGTCTGMTLTGTASGNAASGLFQTTNLAETVATGSCTLTATSSGLTSATSSAFTISAAPASSGVRARMRSR